MTRSRRQAETRVVNGGLLNAKPASVYQITPIMRIASATRTKPAMFAPST